MSDTSKKKIIVEQNKTKYPLMKNSITIGFIAFWVLASSAVFGTIQVPDKIIYNGKEYISRYIYPLDKYFKKYPDKHPTKWQWERTSLYRGYVATFEIKDNQMYLKDIEIPNGDTIDKYGRYHTRWKSVKNQVFPNQDIIKVDWFIGLLELEESEWYSPHNPYILLEIDKGNIMKEKLLKNNEEYKKFKEKQILAFKKTEEYEKFKSEFKVKDIDSALRSFIMTYSSKILVEDDEK